MAEALQHDHEAQHDIEALRFISTEAWKNALTAAKVFTVGGNRIGGIHLRCRAGAVRNDWMDFVRALSGDENFKEKKWLKITPQTSIDRLCGSLDLSATAQQGKRISQAGILSLADQGTLIIGLAEKLEGAATTVICRALDSGKCENLTIATSSVPSRFAIIAIDEGIDESETIPSGLKDRLGLTLDLNPVAYHHAVLPDPIKLQKELPAWSDCATITVPDEIANFFAELSANFGNGSMRTLFHLTDVARILAGIDQEPAVGIEQAVVAIRLCMGISLNAPQEEPETEANSENPPAKPSEQSQHEPQQDKQNPDPAEQPLEIDIEQLLDMAIEAEKAASLGEIDLATIGATKNSQAASGKSGNAKSGARRGRTIGHVTTPPYPDAKPDIAATLRTAAPWQKIRRRSTDEASQTRNIIRSSDFRYKRFKHATRSAAIFVVDASGSTALERLGETKGAIELLFADCYVRRDEVGLIAFRGTSAETVLEPTRSLVRAKRMLSDMTGGGPTPLASGLKRAFQTALNVRRQGFTPVIVLLTDGSANIDLEGNANRKTAARDSELAARQVAAAGIKSVCIDVSRRPRDKVTLLAKAMAADYCPLPNANATSMAKVVSGYMDMGQS